MQPAVLLAPSRPQEPGKIPQESTAAPPPGQGTAGATPPPKASPAASPEPVAFHLGPQREAFLADLQRDTFRFFWDTTPARSGLTPDRFPGDGVSSVAGVGFALTSYLVGVERGWISRTEAADRTLTTLRFLWKAPQGPEPKGRAGYKGFFYHFLDPRSGARVGGSELSTVDTALLMAGVLASQSFFAGPNPTETAIRDLSDRLYQRVDWPWAYSRKHAPLLSMGWTPEAGFLDVDWQGYNEAMLLYVLALGSPTHAIDPHAWAAWTSSYRWDESYGLPRIGFGPLFGHQYSHIWIDFRGIRDAYMATRGIDYFVNSVRATYANRAYCMDNPAKWVGYGDMVWGLTASDGPLHAALRVDPNRAWPFHAYWARGAGPLDAQDDGTVAPTAVAGSVVFAPDVAVPTLAYLRDHFGERLYGKYGFLDAFNLSVTLGARPDGGWFADQYVAIDQGPILLMIDNYRAGFVWDVMKRNPYLRAGLDKAGFAGGWLDPLAGQVSASR